jgi:hypothetical protein
MAYNDQKIVGVLMEEFERLPVRCAGYRKEMMELLVEVLSLEREHAIARINITKRIGDKVNSVGQFLHRERSRGV